jgi:glycosyltransferase involved in cell wall biosynthesis
MVANAARACRRASGRQVAMTRGRVLLTSLSGQLGGMELRLADEARHLRSRGLEATLAPSPFPGRDHWLQRLRAEGLQSAEFAPPPFFEEWHHRHLNWLWARLRHVGALKRLAPDLVHVAFAWTHTGGSRLWLAHRAGIPSVISVHNTFPLEPLSPWAARLAREAFRSVRGIYGVSHSALAAFQANYGEFIAPGTVQTVVHNFVDTQRFLPSPDARKALRAELGLAEQALLIGSVARVDEQKEPLTVLRCFHACAQALPQAHLLYVGSGPLEEALHNEIARLGLEGRVHRMPFTATPERIYPALDLHLLLSRQEGFGISTVEAMSCGVPVMCSDVPGSRDVLQTAGTGQLVPFNDIETSAKAIIALLSTPARGADEGAAGRRAAQACFSREAWQSRLDAFYEQTMPRHQPSAGQA